MQQQQQQQTPQIPPQQNQQAANGQQNPNPNQQPPPPQQTPQKELTLLNFCSLGQETVHDIVSRFQEVFKLLTCVNPPNGTQQGTNMSLERKLKVQEHFRTIRLLFKRLRILYDKCIYSGQQGLEYTNIESFIPMKDEPDNRPEPIMTDEYKKALAENRKLMEMVTQKNKSLKEVIDKLRIIIWEINTMLGMRRS